MSEKSASRIPVLIASSLKPAKDTRAWGKLGLSLRKTGNFRVSFMGFSQIPLDNCEDENFYTSASYVNSAWGRISTQVRFLTILLKVRPKILICCTYEYLPIAAFFKPILGFKLVYDVQENYVKNLELNPTLSPVKKSKNSQIIRWMESVMGIDLYLLAEKCYADEMSEKKPFLVLENKFSGELETGNFIRYEKKQGYSFLISGTLTPAFGTLQAVSWFKEILKEFPESTLKIIGHFTLYDFGIALKKACANIPQIHLKASNFPIPHEVIIEKYRDVNFAMLPYQNRDSIRDKMPTKLFEAAALRVPVLIAANPKWLNFLTQFSGGYPVDFFDLTNASHQLNAALTQDYFTNNPDDSILWKSQHEDFISAINSL